MSARSGVDLAWAVGLEVDRLSLKQREALAGHWIALEVYTPQTLPLRRIEAAGESPAACIAQLCERGRDPRRFEFSAIRSAT